MKWYAIENSDSTKSTIDVMLDHSISYSVWSSTSNTVMLESATELTNIASSWSSSVKDTIRLISAPELTGVMGITFDGTDIYFSDLIGHQEPFTQGENPYSWLFDNLLDCIENAGCNVEGTKADGYWTSTPLTGSPYGVWSMDLAENHGSNYVVIIDNDYDVPLELRPVITINKELLK